MLHFLPLLIFFTLYLHPSTKWRTGAKKMELLCFFLHPFFLLCIFFAHFLLRSFFCRAKKKLRGKKEANCIFYCSAVKKAEQKNEQKKRSGRAQKKKRNDLFYAAGKKKSKKSKRTFIYF